MSEFEGLGEAQSQNTDMQGTNNADSTDAQPLGGHEEGRERKVDYFTFCHNLVDSYPYGLAHGLQKDAIQNSVDARASKKVPVSVEFKVIENDKGCFLTITDKNTIGLIGKGGTPEGDDLKKADARWQRFEGFGFTTDDPGAIGARGQGKFVMLGSSDEYKMFYDTLRADEVYRLGATQATTSGCPLYPAKGVWEGETAESKLASHCGLQPLTDIGTRLIIFSPKEEVLEAFRNGEFAEAVKETWFKSIEKQQLEVYLNIDDSSQKIELDASCMFETKTADTKSWILGPDSDFNDNQIKAGGEIFKIKKLEIFYTPDKEVSEEWRGVALIHHGMKICSLNEGLPEEKASHITGFVEFEKDLDDELRKTHNQDPNHYDLKWRAAIPKAISGYIKTQIREFGVKKLGLFQDPRARKRQEQKDAEDWAMQEFMKYADDINLSGAKGGKSKKRDNPPEPPSDKDIGIGFSEFTFSNPEKQPRVDWGESVSFYLTAFNKTNENFIGNVSLRIHLNDIEIETLANNRKIVIPFEDTAFHVQDEVFKIDIDEDKFPAGEYRIKAQLNNSTRNKEHAITKKIWVGQDPPQKNNFPFELISSPFEKHKAWEIEGSLGQDPKLRCNVNHPEYKDKEDDKDEMGKYILNMCLEAALLFILQKPDEGEDDVYEPLDTSKIREGLAGQPDSIYKEIVSYKSKFRAKQFDIEGG